MSFFHFSWPKIISHTALKYQRPGFVEQKSFLPGERRRVVREMERGMVGFKKIQKELLECRKTMEDQKQKRMSKLEKKIRTSFYLSPLGTR